MYSQVKSFFGHHSLPKATKWVLISNVALFFLQQISNITGIFALFPYQHPNFYPWQVLSYMFMHGDIFHILFNMLVIWVFAPHYESQYGPKKFLGLFLLSGIGVGIFYTLFFNHMLIGASAGVYAILTSFAYFWPNTRIFFMGIFPIKAKILILILILVSIFSSLRPTDNIAHLAHIMGALFGFVFLQFNHRRYSLSQFFQLNPPLNKLTSSISNFFRYYYKYIYWSFSNKNQKKSMPKKSENQKIVYHDQWVKDRVDQILEKISKQGIQSLSKKEKDFLDRISNQ